MSIRSKLSSLREYLTPINHSSNFATTGEISPEEFVKAGDYLVYRFPTWQWSGAPDKLKKDFLPADKQFLITKHVPSRQRCADYLGANVDGADDDEIVAGGDGEGDDEDGWVKSKRIAKPTHVEQEEAEAEKATESAAAGGAVSARAADEVDDIDDLVEEDAEGDEFDDEELVNEDGFSELVEGGSSDPLLRKYDLYITYSTSYRVPKLYLVGFNASGIPLLPKQMFEDISGDYRDKTATIENLPVSFNTTSVSIHPCKHSSVMKVLMAHVKRRATTAEDEAAPKKDEEGDEGEEADTIRVDQYLIVFLKFIASVTPGIEYDYTMDAL